MLFSLSLTDGSVLSQQDVDPPGSNPSVQQQRGGVTVGASFIYVTFGGLYGDCGADHGYVVAVPLGGGRAPAWEGPSSPKAGKCGPPGGAAWSARHGSLFSR